MINRMNAPTDESTDKIVSRLPDAHPIGEILEELLAQYQARFPGIPIAIIETPANAL